MAELQFPDVIGRYQQGLQFGTQRAEQDRQRQNQSRLSELAQTAYGAPDTASREAAIGEAIGVDPTAGLALGTSLQGIQDRKQKALVQSAAFLGRLPPEQQQSAYTGLRGRLSQEFPDLQLPEAWEQAAPTVAAINQTYGGGQPDVKVVGNSLVDSSGRVVYQAPQRFQTEQGLIEVGPEGAREIRLGQPQAQIDPIGPVQQGTGFTIDPSIPPQVAAQIQAQEAQAGGVQMGAPAPQAVAGGARILPTGAGARAEQLRLAQEANARAAEANARAARLEEQRQQFGTIPPGFRVNAAGTALEAVPGGPKPAGAAASEDERKAAGWFNQASRARENIRQVLAENPGADRPGEYEAFGFRGDPEGGPVDRYLASQYQASISPGRQRYNQAISSFGEAVLRAATGAGVNRDEAAQKVRELTPVSGDSAEVRAQKLAGLDGYLSDLQTRAGRALNPANQGAPQSAPVQRAVNRATGQTIELRNGQWVPVDG